MADLFIVSLILVPLLIIIIFSICVTCWKGQKMMPFTSMNRKYYLKNPDLIEMKNSAGEKRNSVDVKIMQIDQLSNSNLLESADNSKEFEHAILEIDNSESKIKCLSEEEVSSCGSLESSNTYYSVHTNRRISTISGVTVYLDAE